MRRALILVALIAGMVFWTPTAALACSCVQRSTDASVKQADSVFEGKVVWTSSNGVEATYGVDVAQVFKGKAATFEKLRTLPYGAPCSLADPVTEQRYVFFVQGEHPGQMQIKACGGTDLSTAKLVDQVEAATGEVMEPVPASGGIVEADSQGLGFVGWAVVVTAVGLLVLLGTTALKRSF